MKFSSVLVVYKKSSYQVYGKERKDQHFLSLIENNDPSVDRFVPSHEIHERSLATVKKILKKHSIKARFIYRAKGFVDDGKSLVISVGGDGTFLEASHYVKESLLLGVNSNTDDSVGMFCSTDIAGFENRLLQTLEGESDVSQVCRLQLSQDGQDLPVPVLNEILIANLNPARTSRMVVRVGEQSEDQKSSGLWVATPCGSTGAIGSAGGKVLPLESAGFQYWVREPYTSPESINTLRAAVLGGNEVIVVQSKMRTGRIFVDGAHVSYRFPIASTLTINAKAPKLSIVAYNKARRATLP